MSSSVLHASIFAGGLLVGAGTSIAWLRREQQQQQKQYPPVATPPPSYAPAPPSPSSSIIPPPGALAAIHSDILRPSGYPGPVADLLAHTVFLSSYDRRLRHPSWTAEHLTQASLTKPQPSPDSPGGGGPDRSHSVFKEDERIPLMFRARLADYFRSGYDRGHMVPAADAKISQHAMDETFLLTNMAPQVGPGFNRDYWAHTEDFVRRLTGSFADVYVFTIPLYLPKLEPDGKHRVTYEVIGNPPNVAVPTHFAKVILASGKPGRPVLPPPSAPLPPPRPATPTAQSPAAEQHALAALSHVGFGQTAATALDPSRLGLAAFVIPNAAVPNEVPLRTFDVPVESVERAAGLTLFPDHVKKQTRHLCSLVGCDIILRELADRASSTRSSAPPSPGARPRSP